MSYATAFFVGIGVGAVASIVLISWAFWRLRKGPQPRSPVQGRIAFALMIGPPIALAFSMPGFDTALVAWLGFPIGMALLRTVVLPLAHLGAQRIDRRR